MVSEAAPPTVMASGLPPSPRRALAFRRIDGFGSFPAVPTTASVRQVDLNERTSAVLVTPHATSRRR